MKSTLTTSYEEAKKILFLAETKRIAENLTKKEMAQILNISNNYYINCISGIVTPSQSIINSLQGYLEMSTEEAYKRVFAFRSSEKYNQNKNSARFMIIDNMFKEKYHDSWEMDESSFIEGLETVKSLNDYFEMPTR